MNKKVEWRKTERTKPAGKCRLRWEGRPIIEIGIKR
jgi:hypothetical protein